MSDLEAAFDFFWRVLEGPELESEVKLCPSRDWRFDRFHGAAGVIIEIEGGTRKNGGGRHNRPDGFEDDCIKYNWTQTQGLALFRLTSRMILDDATVHLPPIIEAIRSRMEMLPCLTQPTPL